MRVPETKLNISRIKRSRYESHSAMELKIPSYYTLNYPQAKKGFQELL
jgi:hypothetical protein